MSLSGNAFLLLPRNAHRIAAQALANSPYAHSRRVHVLVMYIPGPQRGSYILTLGPMYVLYRYLDPLALCQNQVLVFVPSQA